MKLRPIKDALAGEWLLGVYPVMSPEVDAGWNRRLNYFTSRALSHTALQTEQENRGAHLATMGQSVSHGVIDGLEVSVDKSGQRIMISPGAGVTITGEDVFVPRGLNIDIRDVRVYEAVTNVPTDATLTVSPGTGISGLTGSSGLTGKPIDIVVKPGTITGTISSSKKTDIASLVSGKIKTGGLGRVGSVESINFLPSSSISSIFNSSTDSTSAPSDADMLARKLGSSIGDHIDGSAPLAEVGFLVLQPVAVDIRGNNAERDPCEEDSQNDAFENWQMADGCRLIYYAWPSDYLPPEYREVTSLTDSELSWRNRLAHKIFNKEKIVSYHPWDETGVPIAMVGFNNEWKLQFCDRYAVVREGGKPRWRTIRNSTSGSAFLWQARVQQFNQQISEITTNRASALTLSGLTFETVAEKKHYLQQQIQEVRQSFIHLPPVGMLPKQAIDFENNEHYFFRPDYHVEAVAVPLEQLDLALEASAAMDSYDVNVPDRVRVMVPVPQVWYEPELLNTETENPEFQAAVDRFTKTRAAILDRRTDVRAKANILSQTIDKTSRDYPSPDPNAIEENESDWHFLFANSPPSNWMDVTFNDGAWDLIDSNEDPSGRGLFCRKRFDVEDVSVLSKLNISVTSKGIIKFYINSNLVSEDVSVNLNLDEIQDQLINGENILSFECRQSPTYGGKFDIVISLDYDTGESDYGVVAGKVEEVTVLANTLDAKGLLVKMLGSSDTTEFENKTLEYGLQDLISNIKLAHDHANDFVNLKFLKIQSDIYRVSQLMYGNAESTRLVTSPVMANILKGESASGTKTDLSQFYANMKEYIPANVKVDNAAFNVKGTVSGSTTGGVEINTVSDAVKTRGLFSGSGILSDVGYSAKAGATSKDSTIKQGVERAILYDGGIEYVAQTPAYPLNIIGMIPYIRTTDVLQRIIISPAMEAKNAAVYSKYEVVKTLIDMDVSNASVPVGIYFGDISIPGFVEDPGNNKELTEVQKTFADIAAAVGGSPDILEDLKTGKHDPAILRAIVDAEGDGEYQTEPDEAAYFSAAIRALEHASAILRLVEGRLNSFANIPKECESTLVTLKDVLSEARLRIGTINVDLAEARHDVAVSRALLLEEQQRVEQVNSRRKNILDKHVPFLSFYRPRVVDIINDVPTRVLYPALLHSPVPECLSSDAEPPEELDAMISLFRDAPVRWFSQGKELLEQLRKVNQINVTIQYAKARSQQFTPVVAMQRNQGVAGGLVSNSIYTAMSGMQSVVNNYRKSLSTLDLTAIQKRTWKENIRHAHKTVSLGDIIDGKHGNAKVSGQAGQLLEEIERISVCLYQHFSKTPARVRLHWAEKLSQHDQPVNLRNLYSLPRWDEVDYLDRQEMQAYVDWLHNRIDVSQTEASGIVNELVRVCLLLASHAPVNKITSGRLNKSITVKVGDHIEVAIDPARLRVGMEVYVYSGNKPGVKAVINDFNSDYVSARVVKTPFPSVTLTEGARVQVSEPRQFNLNPVTRYKYAIS